MSDRKYLPTLAELIDRLSIIQIKEIKIPEHAAEYAQEIRDIVHDIQLLLDQNQTCLTADIVRAIIVLSQMNLHIWVNEGDVRRGAADASRLLMTHGINGIRNTAKNIIQSHIGGRKDYKIDCTAAAELEGWKVSW